MHRQKTHAEKHTHRQQPDKKEEKIHTEKHTHTHIKQHTKKDRKTQKTQKNKHRKIAHTDKSHMQKTENI